MKGSEQRIAIGATVVASLWFIGASADFGVIPSFAQQAASAPQI